MKRNKKIELAWCYFRIYVSACSWRRCINAFKLLLSFICSKWKNKAKIEGQPLAFSFEPISVCNLRCPECPTGMHSLTRPKGMASVVQFDKVVKVMKSYSWFVNLYFQGEPLMHPEFSTLIRTAKKQKLVTATSTNGHFLKENQAKKIVSSGLDLLIVSLDGLTQQTYEKYRVGGDLNVVLQGVENIIQEKKKQKSFRPLLIAQFLVFRHNEHEVQRLQKFAYDLGFNQVQIKTAQIYGVNKKLDLIPRTETLSRYSIDDKGNVALKGRFRNSCWKQWSSCVFTWDGDLVPCCFDKNAKYKAGNVFKTEFIRLWTGKELQQFRNNLMLNQEAIDICQNCPMSRK